MVRRLLLLLLPSSTLQYPSGGKLFAVFHNLRLSRLFSPLSIWKFSGDKVLHANGGCGCASTGEHPVFVRMATGKGILLLLAKSGSGMWLRASIMGIVSA